MRGFDLQDALLLVGFMGIVGGVAAIYWPAALILAGVIFLIFAYLIERGKRSENNGNPKP